MADLIHIPVASTSGGTRDIDAWVYVSATSFKIENKNVTARFPVGTKLKVTQTTDKYFYVVSAAFSTHTTVTITGGSDYSLANAAIDNPCYSYQSCPQGFPQWFNYSETWTGFSSPPSGGACQFMMDGRMVYMIVARGQNASNATTMTITIPVTSANCYQHSWGTGMNAGTWIEYPCRAQIAPSANIANLSRQLTQAWTSSGNKAWEGLIIYKAA